VAPSSVLLHPTNNADADKTVVIKVVRFIL